MARLRQIEADMLALIGECEVVRRQTLHLLPYHRVSINNTIREMLAAGLIKQKEKGYSKHYILTRLGKERLRDSDWIYEEHEFLPSKVRSGSWDRLILTGDIMIMLHLCGYGVYAVERLSLPDGSVSPNTFSPAMELKRSLGANLPSLQYSRIAGLLVTPDAPYRIYHTRNVAMEIRRTGEKNVAHMVDSKLGQKTKALIFGDRDMVSLEKIINNTLNPHGTANKLRGIANHKKKQHSVTELLTASTLGAHSSYLPLNREALPLLQLYQSPNGLDELARVAKEWAVNYAAYDEYGPVLFGVDRNYYLYVADLQIGRICGQLKQLSYYLNRGTVTMVCVDWQLELWKRITARNFPKYSFGFLPFDNQSISNGYRWLAKKG